jgi:hypothetical protein
VEGEMWLLKVVGVARIGHPIERKVFIQKKIMPMSSVNHADVFGKLSPCFYKTIEMVY